MSKKVEPPDEGLIKTDGVGKLARLDATTILVTRAIDDLSRSCLPIGNQPVAPDPAQAISYVANGRQWLFRADFGDAPCVGKAIRSFSKAIQLDPKRADAFALRGNVWQRHIKDYYRAIKDYDAAIQLDPNCHWVYSSRGEAWMQLKEYERASHDFDDCVRLNDGGWEVYEWRGDARFVMNNYDGAIRDFGEVISQAKGASIRAEFYFARGAAWLAKGNHASARDDFVAGFDELGHAVENGDKDAYRDVSWILATCPIAAFRDGRRALEIATTLCELDDSKGYSLELLAAAHAEAGKFEEAVRIQSALVASTSGRISKQEHAERLELYKQKKPYRDPTQALFFYSELLESRPDLTDAALSLFDIEDADSVKIALSHLRTD
jgi:tetratricopeptide (TPR) repeat protein